MRLQILLYIRLFNSPRSLKDGCDYKLKKVEYLKTTLAQIDPFFENQRECGFMEVVGKGVFDNSNSDLTEAFVHRLEEKSLLQDDMQKMTAEFPIQESLGETGNSSHSALTEDVIYTSDLIAASNRFTFHVYTNEVSSTVLTVHNVGTKAYKFEWVIAEDDNHLKVNV